MKSREIDFLNTLHAENSAFYDTPLGRAALKDLNKLFPRHWLYVAELMQNALDAGATSISFVVRDRDLIAEHDGKAFSADDVRALCVKGGSTKGAGSVGFMGVGFKSIYQAFDTVDLSSGPWRFRLHVPTTTGEAFGNRSRRWVGAMLPTPNAALEPPSKGMTCRFVLSGRQDGLGPIERDLAHLLGDHEALLAILARRGVRRLQLGDVHWALSSKEIHRSSPTTARYRLEARRGSQRSVRSWILLSRTYSPSPVAVRRLLEHRELDPRPEEETAVYAAATRPRAVEAFFEVDDSGRPMLPDRGELFAVLPTSIKHPFGFHLQADWLLAITRQDLMDVSDDAWHEEIRNQVPALLSDYFSWLTTQEGLSVDSRLFRAFPSPSDDEIDAWFTEPALIRAMAESLRSLPCLPALADSTEAGAATDWVAPQDARQLPKELSDQVERMGDMTRTLFGPRVISRKQLGERGAQFLRSVNLWSEISAADLAAVWRGGSFLRWWNSQPGEDDRRSSLEALYIGLADLDTHADWSAAALVCIPTETGTAVTRADARRYPAEWSLLANEPEVTKLLAARIGAEDSRFPFEIDRAWTQARSNALRFLRRVAAPTIDDLLSQWWASVPDLPDEQFQDSIVRVTDWIRTKQSHRTESIPYLLCDGPRGLEIFSSDEALLTEPYAGRFRSELFPDNPPISRCYLDRSDGSASDWATFFLSRAEKPQGPFVLWQRKSGVVPERVNESLANAIALPPISQRARARFDLFGEAISHSRVGILDSFLDDGLLERLKAGHGLSALVPYLEEGTETLRRFPRTVIRYVAEGHEYHTELRPEPARWVRELAELPWVPVQGTDQLLRPDEVLPTWDEARQDVPVAALSPSLREALTACGVPFGRELPKAPALTRLRIHGPTAPTSDLLQWVQEVVADSTDADRLKHLSHALEGAILPLPTGVITVDGSIRLPLSRFIRYSRPRSDLGGWLVSLEKIPADSDLRTLLASIDAHLPIPDTATGNQVVAFLSWVYDARPEADKVRQALPLAYAYLEEDGTEAQWDVVRRSAAVYVRNQRRWLSVDGGSDLYLDDLNDRVLEPETRALQLATPGHLGSTPTARAEISRRLGLSLLSSRFRLDTEVIGPDDLPSEWRSDMNAILSWFQGEIDRVDADEEGGDDPAGPRRYDFPSGFTLSRHHELRKRIFDQGALVRTMSVPAVVEESAIAVTGEPTEFSEDLAQLLVHRFGLSRRHDVVRLTAQAMGHLLCLGRGAALSRRLRIQESNIPGTTTATDQHDSAAHSGSSESRGAQADAGNDSDALANVADPSTGGSSASTTEPEPGEQLRTSGTPEPSASPSLPISAPSTGTNPSPPRRTGSRFTEDHLTSMVRAMFVRLDPGSATDQSGNAPQIPDPDRRSDETPYREEVMRWETQAGRHPEAKDGHQPGHDIDSFSHPIGDPRRRLVRRIEVKGKGVSWQGSEVVTPSMRQFLDAALAKVEEGTECAPEFDYWLYVVETDTAGMRRVLPIKNPARAGKLAMRGDLWRLLVEQAPRPPGAAVYTEPPSTSEIASD